MCAQSTVRTLAVTGLIQVFLATALPTEDVSTSSRLLHRRKEPEFDLEKDKKTRNTWVVAGGIMVGVVVLCTAIWVFWRRNIIPSFFSRKQKVHDISGPMVGGHYSNNKASKQNPHKRGSMTESVSSLVCDNSERPESNYNYRNYHNISAPRPALAPSNLDLSSNPSRSHLIRHDLLSSKSKQNNHTFFLDASDNGADRGISNPHERRVDLNKAPNPPAKSADQYSQYVPPPIPDSPSRRYSWMSGKSGKTNRTSMESEPPKFRGVNSWVGDQAVRIEEKEMRKPNKTTADAGVRRGDADQMTLASATSVPPTPAEFKHHPGQMVEFLAKEKRVDSRVLDRMDEKHASR